MCTITHLIQLIFLGGLTAAFVAPLGNHAQLENRETFQHACRPDNCLRALLSPRHSAEVVSFCETYIPPAHTYTIDTTETMTSTFAIQLVQPITTITDTSFVTTYTTTTTTHSHSLPSPPPRTSSPSLLPRDPPPPPAFLSACCSSPSKLSSACSCLIAPITFITHISDVTVAIFGGTRTLPTITVAQENVVTEVETSTVTIFEP